MVFRIYSWHRSFLYRMVQSRLRQRARSSADCRGFTFVAFLIAVVCLTGLGIATFAAFSKLQDHVVATLSTHRPLTPVTVYSRPSLFRVGDDIGALDLVGHLQDLGYRDGETGEGEVAIGEYRVDDNHWTVGRRAFRWLDREESPKRVSFETTRTGKIATFSSLDDTLVLEPQLLDVLHNGGAEYRERVDIDDVPALVIHAVLAAEDQRFYQHYGLDGRRIFGALLKNVRERRITEGGSTLTQQLVKNVFLTGERTWSRKAKEAVIALAIEGRMSKRDILEIYLNEIYLGQAGSVAIHGVKAASRHYFAKDLSELDVAEAAMIAGIIAGPSLFSPYRNPEAARGRRNKVLDAMVEFGVLKRDEAALAKYDDVELVSAKSPKRRTPYFVDAVREAIAEDSDVARESAGGTRLFSTLDMVLQRVAEGAVRDGIGRIEQEHPKLKSERNPLQAAFIVLDPNNGDVLAMVGGRAYEASQFNRATSAWRQPGSAFKPFVALAGLSNRGRDGVTLATVLDDSEFVLETSGGPWSPRNYDRQFRGPVRVRVALEKSLNVPFARLGQRIGPDSIVSIGHSLGFSGDLQAVPAIALGAAEVTPLEMAGAYAVLASGGIRRDPRLLKAAVITDGGGESIRRTKPVPERAVFNAAETYLVTSALEGAVNRGTGYGLRKRGIKGTVAAKTGTTNQYRDAWFAAYTPSVVIVAWVGFDESRDMGLSGAAAALPLVADFLSKTGLADAERRFPGAADVVRARVQPSTGLYATGACESVVELFLPSTVPSEPCIPDWLLDEAEPTVVDGGRARPSRARQPGSVVARSGSDEDWERWRRTAREIEEHRNQSDPRYQPPRPPGSSRYPYNDEYPGSRGRMPYRGYPRSR